MAFAFGATRLETRDKDVDVQISKDQQDFAEEQVDRMLRDGGSGSVTVTLKRGELAGKEVVTARVARTSAYNDFVSLAAEFSGYPGWSGTPLAKIVKDPSCNYIFSTIRAVASPDGGSLAKYLYDDMGNSRKASFMHNDEGFKLFEDSVKGHNGDLGHTDNVSAAQISEVEYGMVRCLADKSSGEQLSSVLASGCAKALAVDFKFDKNPAEARKQVHRNIVQLLHAAESMNSKAKAELVKNYVGSLGKSQTFPRELWKNGGFAKNAGLTYKNGNAVEEFRSIDDFVREFVKAREPQFHEQNARSKLKLLESIRDGVFPGMEASGPGPAVLNPPSVYISSMSGGRSVQPKADIFMALSLAVKERTGDNYARGGSFGFISTNDVTKNLLHEGKDKDGNLTYMTDSLRPLGTVECFTVRDNKLYRMNFTSVDAVSNSSLRQTLVQSYRKPDAALGPFDARGVKNIAVYFGMLKAASAVGAQFITDEKTVSQIRDEASRLIGEISRGANAEQKLAAVWKGIDDVSTRELNSVIAAAGKQQAEKDWSVTIDDGFDVGR